MIASQRRSLDLAASANPADEPTNSQAGDVAWRSEAQKSDMSDADWHMLQHEVARYVASMTTELANMARSGRFELLAYFLDMAHAEAEAQAELTEG